VLTKGYANGTDGRKSPVLNADGREDKELKIQTNIGSVARWSVSKTRKMGESMLAESDPCYTNKNKIGRQGR